MGNRQNKMPPAGQKSRFLRAALPAAVFLDAPLRKFGNFVFPIRQDCAMGQIRSFRCNWLSVRYTSIPMSPTIRRYSLRASIDCLFAMD
uniref:Uncharacterized protein n=1 Tax=Candidatus Kentrum sp. DK TaxID=2126562 RepID=A0A450TEX6_9GAMM|nr:MAG: hypothetical protein BECKDK2373B_GA0170837_11533 [Candidatus Kentron sp. DK]